MGLIIFNILRTRKNRPLTYESARIIGNKIRVDWRKISIEEFMMGLKVELEHGKINSKTNVTWNNPILTGKIALAHLNEFPDYYSRLKKMEAEAKLFWGDTY